VVLGCCLVRMAYAECCHAWTSEWDCMGNDSMFRCPCSPWSHFLGGWICIVLEVVDCICASITFLSWWNIVPRFREHNLLGKVCPCLLPTCADFMRTSVCGDCDRWLLQCVLVMQVMSCVLSTSQVWASKLTKLCLDQLSAHA